MTESEFLAILTGQEARLRGRQRPWVVRAEALIRAAAADARAHAEMAVSAVRSGSTTARRPDRTPSFAAAEARLAAAAVALAGSDAEPLSGLVRDAREAFYRDSFEAWKAMIPRESWVEPDAKPSLVAVAGIRRLPIHGVDVGRETAAHFAAAAAHLRRAAAAEAEAPSGRAAVWERLRTDSLILMITSEIGDSNMAAHSAAANDLVHPDSR